MSVMRAMAALVLVLAFLLGTSKAAHAQPKPGAVAAPTPAVSPEPEVEAADSPRASMRTFFDLCGRYRYEEAAHYLDLPKGADKRGAELARKLQEVLDQRLWVDVERLSPLAGGRKEDALPKGTEELGKIVDAKGHPIPIRIVRHDPRSPEDEPRWVFSQATMLAVDGLHAALKAKWMREHLPAPLLADGPLSLYYWQWIALPLLAAGCGAVGRVLTWFSRGMARRLASRRPWGERLVQHLVRPITMAWAVGLFWFFLPYLGLTIRADDLVVRVLRALGWLAFFWVLLRGVSVAGDEIADARWATLHPNMRSITGVGVRLGKLVVAVLALMVALSQLGYPVTTVVAGLGIGGVALALAAQKTVENLFGSISILADQPFKVGDTIRVDSIEGAVETIGLRSTRIRTLERTLVIIPNGKLADMRIESLGARERIRFSTKLALGRETTIGQIQTILEAVRTHLKAHDAVLESDVLVQLGALGESSFDVDVAALVETTNTREFARIREELLFECVRAVEEAGATLAFPTRQLVSPTPEKKTETAAS